MLLIRASLTVIGLVLVATFAVLPVTNAETTAGTCFEESASCRCPYDRYPCSYIFDTPDSNESDPRDPSRSPRKRAECVEIGPPRRAISCVDSAGHPWTSKYQCYKEALNPQPAPEDPRWQGHTGGGFWQCVGSPTSAWWEPSPIPGQPGPAPAPPPDPEALARQAIASMTLDPIRIGMAPPPSNVSLVRLPVWMWVDAPSRSTWGPYKASASDRGLTITAEGVVDHVDWDMGDGTVVTCQEGTARPPVDGVEPSPDCGHQYTTTSKSKPGGRFAITATTSWHFRYSANGGPWVTLPDTIERSSTTSLRVEQSRAVLVAP